jgi:hypothetical protein
MPLKFVDPAIAKAYQDYITEKKEKHPRASELNNLLYALPENQQAAFSQAQPELQSYSQWNNLYLATHPEIIPFAVGKESYLYGADPKIQQQVYTYRALKDTYFPNLDQEFAEYSAIDPNAKSNIAYPQTASQAKKGTYSYMKARAVYRQQHPDIDNYYSFRDAFVAANPKAAPYIVSESTLASIIQGQDQQQQAANRAIIAKIGQNETLLRRLYTAGATRGVLSAGARMTLEPIWESFGKPEGNFNDWLENFISPTFKVQL